MGKIVYEICKREATIERRLSASEVASRMASSWSETYSETDENDGIYVNPFRSDVVASSHSVRSYH